MNSSPRTYLTILLGGLFAVLACSAALNVVADPFGVYRGAGRSGLPPESLTSRITVAERVRQLQYDTLVVGSSRISALLQDSPQWADRQALVACMPGASMEEMQRVVELACRENRPQQIVVAVDFFQLAAARTAAPEFHRSRLSPELSWFEYHCDKLFGRNALKQSWRAWREGRVSLSASAEPPAVVPTEPAEVLAPPSELSPPPAVAAGRRRTSFELDATHYLSPNGFYGGFRYAPARDEEFRRLSVCAAEHDVELIVVILPVHAVDLEALRIAGHWQAFEDWKRRLPQTCRAVAAEHHAAVAHVWDFTGYTLQRAEPVPGADSTAEMTWYVNGSHFTSNFGEHVLHRILHQADVDDELAVRLDRIDVERHLAKQRADRERWIAANAAEAENIRRIALRAGCRAVEEQLLTARGIEAAPARR